MAVIAPTQPGQLSGMDLLLGGPLAVNMGTPQVLKPLLPGNQPLLRFPIMDEAQQVGEALLTRFGNALNVQNIGHELGRRLSTAEWRRLFGQVLQRPEFQGVERITGMRVSGMGGEKVLPGGVFKVGQELDLPIHRFLRQALESTITP